MAARRMARSAFTLIEMLLVLAVLVAFTTIAWPSFQRLYATQYLLEGGELVRLQFASTRTRAIESGIVYQFRWEPDGRRYLSLPYEAELDLDPEGDVQGALTGTLTRRFVGELPEKLKFVGGADSGGQSLPPELFESFPDSDKLAAVAWSAPVLFQPDGSAVDGELIIGDQSSRRVALVLRGATGAISVSPIQQERSGNGK